ncbi:M-phase inducer phosphatase 3 [Dictyocoela muelleri]|nr:M-phase inducer phosphatase 3 [Dictyocoela muelleri]
MDNNHTDGKKFDKYGKSNIKYSKSSMKSNRKHVEISKNMKIDDMKTDDMKKEGMEKEIVKIEGMEIEGMKIKREYNNQNIFKNKNLYSFIPKYTKNEILESIKNKDILDNKPFEMFKTKIKNSGLNSRINIDRMKNQSIKIHNFSFPTSNIRNSDYLIDFWANLNSGEIHTLPTIGTGHSDSIKRITGDTLIKLINTPKKFKIIDCRYDYEFIGGHIRNSINVDFKEGVKTIFNNFKGNLIVFYCEFSSVRAPKLACELRNFDRKVSEYPSLEFPEIYILEGGYSNFFERYSLYCEPNGYVSMSEKPKK